MAGRQYLWRGAAVACSVALGMTTLSAQSAPAAKSRGTAAAKSTATGTADAGTWKMERTPDGHPDMQGVWANNTVTPLERPEVWKDKKTLSEAEIKELQAVAAQIYDNDGDAQFGEDLIRAILQKITKPGSYDPGTGNYNQFWIVGRDWHDRRTSLLTDPADGKLPPMVPAAKARREKDRETRKAHAFEDPEMFPTGERCVNFGVPRIGAGYNSYFSIVQSANYVTVMAEMAHDARIIPTDGRPHAPKAIRNWNGDSRGHWEGDTLVIDTTNFSSKSDFMGSRENLHLIEKFTRVSKDILNWEITVDDPSTWTKPWTMMIPLARKDELIYEYACHEANESMEGMLKGHRYEEKQKSSSNTTGSR